MKIPKQCSVKDFCDYLYFSPELKERVIDFYLGLSGQTDAQVLKYLAQNHGIEDHRKAELFSFLLYPKMYIEKLIEDLQQAARCLESIYKEKRQLLEQAKGRFSYERFLEMRYGSTCTEKIKEKETLHVVFTVCNRKHIWRLEDSNSVFLFLGTNWEEEAVKGVNEFSMFGNAIGDPVRWQIFNIIVEQPGITVSEIMQNVGKSRNTVVHHLDLLKSANLVIKQEGRKSGYNVDKVVFSGIVNRLFQYIAVM